MYKTIPDDVKKFIENSINISNREIIFNNNDFVVMEDIKHKKNCYHYTAWYKHDCKSLIDINDKCLEHIKNLLSTIKSFKTKPLIFIHFPPSHWNLHIHFTQATHVFGCPIREIFYIDKVIENLSIDSEYYRKRVFIDISSNI